MNRHSATLVWMAAALVSIAGQAFAEQAADPWAAVLRYKIDQPRTALVAVEAEIHAARPDQRDAMEARLVKMLQSPEATTDAKVWACRQLRIVGSEQCVPAVAPLLADKDLATAARWALQSIAGDKASAALREALPRLEGNLKVGVILTLGARKDRQAVALLAPLAADKDPATGEAALYALGHVGGADALAALRAAAVPDGLARYRFDAILLCADGLAAEGKAAEAAGVYREVLQQSADPVIKTAALRGLVATEKGKAAETVLSVLKGENAKLRMSAARFICELAGPEALAPVLTELASLPADVQVAILGMAEAKAVLPAAQSALMSGEPSVRAAALEALGRLGDASVLKTLLAAAAGSSGDEPTAAREALARLRGAEVDGGLIAAAQAGETEVCLEAIRALTARNATSAVETLLQLAVQRERPTPGVSSVRAQALQALGALADLKTLPAMVRLLAEAKGDHADDITGALTAVCRRIDDKDAAAACVLAALPGLEADRRSEVLRVSARIPAARALGALREALGDASPSVQDVAVRGLADWPDASAMPDLLHVARSTKSNVHKTVVLRGVVRMAEIKGVPPERAAKALAEALALADRPDDKKMVLAALGNVAHPAALEAAAGRLGDNELELDAATATVRIAKGLRLANPDAAKAAVQKVLDTCKSPAARQVAESALVVVDVGLNIAPQGTATSPDGLESDGAAGGDQAAIDNDPNTYWDEEDNKGEYRLVVTFKQPEKIAAVSILGYEHHRCAPRDFEIVCDGKAVKKVAIAQYDNNVLVVGLDAPVTATSVELKITGYYGGSPAIRELGIYRAKAGK